MLSRITAVVFLFFTLLSTVGVKVHQFTCLHSGNSQYKITTDHCCKTSTDDIVKEPCCENQLFQLESSTFQKTSAQPEIVQPIAPLTITNYSFKIPLLRKNSTSYFLNRPPPKLKQPIYKQVQSFLC